VGITINLRGMDILHEDKIDFAFEEGGISNEKYITLFEDNCKLFYIFLDCVFK
jgi:hypothetical protein